MPSGAIKQQDGVRALCHVARDFIEMKLHGGGVGEGQAELLQQRSDMAFMIVDAEALVDDALKIDAPPAHDAVDLSVGASFDDRREFGFPQGRRRRQTLRRFDLSLSTASLFIHWSGVLSALSYPVAAWLSRRIGLVNTMVFTHIPASLCLIAAAFAPWLSIALGLLLVRATLSQVDAPARSSYVMTVVSEAERPAAASFTSVPRSLAASLSPAFSGALFSLPWAAASLVICGALKIAYDLFLLNQFRNVKPPEDPRHLASATRNERLTVERFQIWSAGAYFGIAQRL